MDHTDTDNIHIIQMYTEDIFCGNAMLHANPNEPYDRWLCARTPHHPAQPHEAIDGTKW